MAKRKGSRKGTKKSGRVAKKGRGKAAKKSRGKAAKKSRGKAAKKGGGAATKFPSDHDIRRMARRAGVTCPMAPACYDEVRQMLRDIIRENVLAV
eukprot:gene47226-53361_t